MQRSNIDSAVIFSGQSIAKATDIRDALGWLEPTDEEALPKLIGSVMSLCLAVQQQAVEIDRLRHKLESAR